MSNENGSFEGQWNPATARDCESLPFPLFSAKGSADLNTTEDNSKIMSNRNPNTQKCPECGKMSLRRVSEPGLIHQDGFGGEIQDVNVYFECPCGYGESAQ